MKKVDPKDLAGKKFSRLTVVSYAGRLGKEKRHSWLCKCDCGNGHTAMEKLLLCGHTKSCGCYQRDSRGQSVRTHGRSKDKEYQVWYAIIRRCTEVDHPDYKFYGGRGITIHPEWTGKEGFQKFMAHIGEKPSDGMTVERIDNNKGYVPGNLRWATRLEQAANTRMAKRITFRGEVKTMRQWAITLGISYSVVQTRIKRGWDHERALTEPIQPYPPPKKNKTEK